MDISGIDIYRNDRLGWGSYRDDTYPKAFDIMSQVTPHKMLALCECAGIPDPDKMAQDGPRWLFCIPWAAKAEPHPPEWMKKTYNHELVITRDQLPKLNVAREGR